MVMSVRRQRFFVALGLLLVVVGWATGFFTGSMLVLYPMSLVLVVPVARARSSDELASLGAFVVIAAGGLWIGFFLLSLIR